MPSRKRKNNRGVPFKSIVDKFETIFLGRGKGSKEEKQRLLNQKKELEKQLEAVQESNKKANEINKKLLEQLSKLNVKEANQETNMNFGSDLKVQTVNNQCLQLQRPYPNSNWTNISGDEIIPLPVEWTNISGDKIVPVPAPSINEVSGSNLKKNDITSNSTKIPRLLPPKSDQKRTRVPKR